MKPRFLSQSVALAAAVMAALSAPLYALDSAQPALSSQTTDNACLKVPAPQASKGIWMSREASDVLKLVRSGVNDDVVIAFIQNSRSGFNLTADEIVQLHNEGVSDKMINAMLARKKQIPHAVVSAPQTEAAPQQQVVVQPQAPAPVITQPQVTYVQSQPVYVPAASYTYVYRDPYYSYYDPFYYSWYPGVTVNFGWGRGYYGGYRYGGWGHYPYYGHYGGGHYGGGHYGGGHYGGGYRGGTVGFHGNWSGGLHGGFGGRGHR